MILITATLSTTPPCHLLDPMGWCEEFHKRDTDIKFGEHTCRPDAPYFRAPRSTGDPRYQAERQLTQDLSLRTQWQHDGTQARLYGARTIVYIGWPLTSWIWDHSVIAVPDELAPYLLPGEHLEEATDQPTEMG